MFGMYLNVKVTEIKHLMQLFVNPYFLIDWEGFDFLVRKSGPVAEVIICLLYLLDELRI